METAKRVVLQIGADIDALQPIDAATFGRRPPQERGRSASGGTGSRIGLSSCGSRGGSSTGSLYGCGSFTGGSCGSAGCGRAGMTGSLDMQANVGRND
jgi:hypothetical protein